MRVVKAWSKAVKLCRRESDGLSRRGSRPRALLCGLATLMDIPLTEEGRFGSTTVPGMRPCMHRLALVVPEAFEWRWGGRPLRFHAYVE